MKFFMFHLMPWPYLPADFEPLIVMPQVRAEVDQNLFKRLGAATTLGMSEEARV